MHKRVVLITALILTSLFLPKFLVAVQEASAACSPLPTDKGVATITLGTNSSGTYRVWVRMKAASSSNNSLFLQINDSVCGVVVGDGSLQANTWTWVDYQNGNTSSKINTTLSSGNHTIKVAGRESGVRIDKVLFVVDTNCTPQGDGSNCEISPDTTAPSVPGNVRLEGKTSTSATIAWNASSDPGGIANYDVLRNNTVVSSVNQTTFTDTGLNPNTSYTYSVRARDTSGNLSSTSNSVQVTTDNSPVATTKLSTPTNLNAVAGDGKVSLTWDSVGGANNYTVRWGTGGAWSSYSNDGNNRNSPTTNSYTVTGLTNGTVYNFSVAARDSTGTRDGSDYAATVNATPADTTPPTVTLTAPLNNATISGAQVNVSADASDAGGVSKVEFYLNSWQSFGADSQSPYSLNIDSTNLANGQTYRLHAVATDNQGNTTSSQVINVLVDNSPQKDTQPPVRPSGLSVVSTTIDSVRLKWNASTDNVGVTGYNVYRDNFRIANVTGTTFTDNGLETDTDYDYYVTAFDAESNESEASTAVQATTDAPADAQPPTISINQPANNATVSGSTIFSVNASDESGIKSVDFYVNDSFSLGSRTTAPYQVNIDTTRYTNGQTYRLHAVATDNQGNTTSSQVINVLVDNSPKDTMAPSVPSDVRATSGGTAQINVSWDASTDNTSVALYEVYRNYNLVGTVNYQTTSFGDTGLSPDTSYSYTIRAKDAAGNISAHSALANAKTDPVQTEETGVGSLFGRVTNSSGNPVSGATINLVIVNKRFTYTTSTSGYYYIQSIPAGAQKVSYSATNYETQVVEVGIKANQFNIKDIALNDSTTIRRRSWWWWYR